MPISVTDLSAMKIAVKLPRAALSAERFAEACRRFASSRRGRVIIGCVLVTALVFLHWMSGDSAVRRNTDMIAQLAVMKWIDARWDVAVLQSRTDDAPASVVQSADVTRIQRTLDAAAAEARTNPLRATIAELRKAYVEKADVVTRLEKAAAESRYALAAAMRADAAVTALVRGAWRDFPQRERLVAAENLVSRVLAEVQQYHYAPTAAHRAALEAYAADLPRAQALPRTVQTGLAHLESDVHKLLQLKPLEQMLGERLAVLDTATRADQLIELYQRELADTLARRDRYRLALFIYSAVLIALLVYLALRAYAHYRDLRILYGRQTTHLAKALRRLRDIERPAHLSDAQRRAAGASDDTVHIISEYRVPPARQ
jgi:two-component system NtrC family sensor kinase